MQDLTPTRLVSELDRYIVGQAAAKRAVAVAVRMRWRRMQLSLEFRREVTPKNLLLIGPTGVGKTEIARRMAALVGAPLLKVEASKYTEVGYVGRDVESMIRDLVEVGIDQVRGEMVDEVRELAKVQMEERILDSLLPGSRRMPWEPMPPLGMPDAVEQQAGMREDLRQKLRAGGLDQEYIVVSLLETMAPLAQVFSGSGTEYMGIDASTMAALRGGSVPKKTKRMRLIDAKRAIEREEQDALLDKDRMLSEAMRRVEELGIIFIDEIDKIAGRSHDGGPDVSREGVQRDLLPIVEGCAVNTRYGPIRSDHILFIAAGAFHISRPDDLIPELQGRFPVRVFLDTLEKGDFIRILTEPVNALPKQYKQLLAVDGVDLQFETDGIDELASIADRANIALGDIGARRLHTVVELLVSEISYKAPDALPSKIVKIKREYVRDKLRFLYEQCESKTKMLQTDPPMKS
ncbi:MAG: ATP-dependent protease ATPase subunit HslU [Planctomycetes bacterium]|nr:ATP-dependent protease ATPase subunit HslU [Planctomycetota bacterium]